MELNVRPMPKAEQMYCYAQSQQISSQCGLIDPLRVDMDSNGQGFFSNFFDFRSDLKAEEFKAELNEVIHALRFDEDYGNMLTNRAALSTYCGRNPQAVITDSVRIQIQYPDGIHGERACRYIDDYHLEVDGNAYHICEFAELMEQRGAEVVPLGEVLPDKRRSQGHER